MDPSRGYAELHCHTNFSFLDGASHPEELVEEAARLGLHALAITDHDGLYGAVRFTEAARGVGLPTVFGAELTIGAHQPPNGMPDPPGEHLVVLAQGPVGYARLARAISTAQLAGEKGAPRLTLTELAAAARAPVHLTGATSSPRNDTWFVLTGCRKGTVPAALARDGPAAARSALEQLVASFGRDRVLIELWDHGDPLDRHRNDALVQLALRTDVGVVATNNVHYATPARRQLATALAAVRARRSLDELDGWLPAAPFAHLRHADEQHRRFARWPGAVERTVEIADECAFDLRLAAPRLPDYPVPPGHTETTWLRELVRRGAAVMYPSSHPHHGEAMRQITYELSVIEQLGFPGYFLLLHEIVEFCRTSDIYCQGRGSAANSAVCYALGVTKADAVALGLLFERFLSPEREGPPDIDLDIEHQRREEVIQYVYDRYGRERAAQVANVITYRPRSALREMAKATGVAPGQADALARWVDRWAAGPEAFSELSVALAAGRDTRPAGARRSGELARDARSPHHDSSPAREHQTRRFERTERDRARDGAVLDGPPSATRPPAIPALALRLASEVLDFPRHLGIHSGGMVMADRPLVEFCPVEWARMEGRSVLQWDKDDCAAAGLVKFDLLGLGMLSMLHLAVDMIREYEGVEIDLATIPQEPEVYDLLCAADTVGVFQVESRAQMATLPRLRPRCFYDLVVEVALIRPGPIQGGSVHPYLRRRNGEEEVTYLHPLLEPSLRKTLGVPLFQEQLMQMAVDVAGFSAAEADQLRQAMGSKRSHARMARMRDRLLRGMAERGITGETAAQICQKLEAFADFGFPESHSVSFAYLVYSSSWIKYHYPAEFAAALLNAQPMGFYSPHTIVRDARRHGVAVLGPDLHASRRDATLELRPAELGPVGAPLPGFHAEPSNFAVRLGLRSVRGLHDALLDHLDDERERQPFVDLEDFVRRTGATVDQVEALATAGAFEHCFGQSRRTALWAAGAIADARPTVRRNGTVVETLPGLVSGASAPQLPGMTESEEVAADLWAMGLTVGKHPTEFVRAELDRQGVVTATALRALPDRTVVEVAGVVTHRQQPATAKGTVFLNLEDETGLVNVICTRGVWKRFRIVARGAPALRVRGVLERHQGVINLVAGRITRLPISLADGVRSRDFR
ncbi:MAG TPA: error-prone DNA polymerase [Acidimicrobiia bacterium]|nr:error-prone DNA polymerase [Acidimicrobiia bacterium]